MVITVQIAADVARALQQKAHESDDSRRLLQALDELGVMLKPMHPRTDEPALSGWFTIEAPDLAVAEHVIGRLQERREIEAAYIKPPDEMP